jgi:hypothetical protein
LGLAETDGRGGIAKVPDAVSPSAAESMSRGSTAWRHYPLFPANIEFNQKQPRYMRDLDETPFAHRLHQMFGIGIHGDDVLYRYSFWTGDERDDVPPLKATQPSPNILLSGISPEPPQFALERLETARAYVSLLLGGEENMWANVDFAGAFATAVGGRPVIPHIVRSAKLTTTREEFVQVAAKLRPGLHAVVMNSEGTACQELRASGASEWLIQLEDRGYKIYGKTGTLAEGENRPSTSRLVLAIVRWKGNRVERGEVLSLVVERANRTGLAAEWLGEFLIQNSQLLNSFL